MDVLHLSYDEVVNKIPYRNLVIMQKDKLRVCYGERMQEVTDSDMFKTGNLMTDRGVPEHWHNLLFSITSFNLYSLSIAGL